MTALILAALVAAPVPWPHVGVVGWAVVHPSAAVPVVAAAWWARRRSGWEQMTEVQYLTAIAAELRSGATVRRALDMAAGPKPAPAFAAIGRLCRAGLPAADIAESLRAALPRNGIAAATAFEISVETGGAAAAAFDELAHQAAERAVLAGELRLATAQARVSGLIVGGLPMLMLGWQAATGRLGVVLATGVGRYAVGVGSLLVVAGGAVMWRMIVGALR